MSSLFMCFILLHGWSGKSSLRALADDFIGIYARCQTLFQVSALMSTDESDFTRPWSQGQLIDDSGCVQRAY